MTNETLGSRFYRASAPFDKRAPVLTSDSASWHGQVRKRWPCTLEVDKCNNLAVKELAGALVCPPLRSPPLPAAMQKLHKRLSAAGECCVIAPRDALTINLAAIDEARALELPPRHPPHHLPAPLEAVAVAIGLHHEAPEKDHAHFRRVMATPEPHPHHHHHHHHHPHHHHSEGEGLPSVEGDGGTSVSLYAGVRPASASSDGLFAPFQRLSHGFARVVAGRPGSTDARSSKSGSDRQGSGRPDRPSGVEAASPAGAARWRPNPSSARHMQSAW